MWTGKCFEIDLQFIRHGLTPLNEKKCYISYTDEGLSDKGIADINNRVSLGFYGPADMVFTSSRLRTKQTAELIYPGRQQVEIPELDEISFGKFEGKSYEQLKDNEDYKAWLESNCLSKIPGGESREEFVSRQKKALEEILLLAKDKERISVVTHGGTVMALCSAYTDLDYYDGMIKSGEKVCCHICYEIKGKIIVYVSSFSIITGDNP